MPTRRHLLTLGAAASALTGLGALTGCGDSGSSGSGGKTTVSVYSWRQEDTEGFTKLFDQFTADNPDITVKFQPFNSTDYDQILQTALKSGDKLDLVQLRPYAGAKAVLDTGQFEPLDDLDGLSSFPKEYLDAAKGSDNKVYGVPLALNELFAFYNVAVFDKHDVEVPKTWPDFLAACEKLKKGGVTAPIAQSGKAAYLLSIMHAAIGMAGLSGTFVQDAIAGNADFTSPEFAATVQRALDIKPYFPEGFIGMVDEEARAMFAQGKSAIYINGDYRQAPLQDMNADLKMDFIPSLPDQGDGAKMVNAVDSSFGLSANSENKDAAKKLLQYMTTADFGTAFAKTFHRLSAAPGTKPEDDMHKKLLEWVDDKGTPFLLDVIGGGQPDCKEEFENGLQGVYNGQQDLAGLLQATQKAYETGRANQ